MVAKFKNEYQAHDQNRDPGFGGWKNYKEHKELASGGCADDEPVVHNWFWHIFDILILIDDFIIVCVDIGVAIIISFVTAIVWTCAHIVDPDDEAKATNISTGGASTQGRLESGTTFSSLKSGKGPQARKLWHIMPSDNYDPEDKPHGTVAPPALMVIVGILKSIGIYDPYVFIGYWGGKHDEVTEDGDLTLIPTASGSYDTGGTTITINIIKATYKTGANSPEKGLDLNNAGGPNTLVLTSATNITQSQTHNITREPSSLNLTLKTADASFTAGTYNVSLNITQEITLSGSSIKLKSTNSPVSLGTYTLSVGTNKTTYTGTPQTNDIHSTHQGTNCCIFGKQNTWSTKPAMYTWHAFTILAPFQICLAGIFIYCLHYPDSSIARSIVNQPKMSTFLSIVFYVS